MDYNLKGYLTLGKIGAVVTNIGYAEIGDGRAVPICAAVLGDDLAV